MLGTNELKSAYNKTIEEVGEMFETYIVKTILNRKSQISDKYLQLLIIAPPLADDDGNGKYEGAYEKSLRFNEIYRGIAKRNNCYFIDNSGLETGVDKVHLTKESHALLADKLSVEISKIFKL